MVKRVPNPYQVTYEDGLVWRTIHVNHAKPAKTPADGFPAPLPTPQPPKPTLECLPRSLQRPLSQRPLPPQPATPTAGPPHSAAAQPAATPPSSRPSTRSAANRNSAPRAVQQPPTAPGRTSENSRPGQPLRRSARLTPRACAITSPPQLLKYGQCLGHKEDPYSFSSLFLEDLHSGRKEYLANIQQLVDALPKSLDPVSRFSLKAQVTPPRQQRLPHSMRAALWWLLPSDGEFQRAPSGTQYYLARQGRRVVLRGGDVTQAGFGSRVNWIYDPAPSAPRRATLHSGNIPVLDSNNEASAIATRGSSGAPLTPSLPKKCRRRRRRQAR